METRTAPRWIRDLEKRYARMRWVWMCGTVAGWLGWLGWLILFLSEPKSVLGWVSYGVCFAACFGKDVVNTEVRAQRYRTASSILASAILRYEAGSDCSESALTDAAQRARESLRIERIRSAPEWIRRERRGYRLRVLAWLLPAFLLTAAFFGASVLFRWRTAGPWPMLIVFLLLLILSVIKTRGLVEACQILRGAIERYEFESAGGDEGALIEADQTASALLEKPIPHSS
jgi:hypothetical protein